MPEPSDPLRRAHDAHGRRDWAVARAEFLAAGESGLELSAHDLDALGDCGWWLGLGEESMAAYEGAYRLFTRADQPRKAAMSAGGVAVTLFLRGDATLGSGSMARARRLLADEPECAEHGYLLYAEVEGGLEWADLDSVLEGARRLQDLGRRQGDPALVAVGVLAAGRALVRKGEVREGLALLDEAMLAALSDELAPAFTGNIYCHLVAACWELADIRRAREWTAALERWLARLPAAVVFAGICRAHRAQLLLLQGDWTNAEREAQRVCAELADVHVAPVAEGWYVTGDARRLRGDLPGAEDAYSRSHHLGRDPQPGRAMLHLAHGRLGAAATSIRSALAAEPRGPLQLVRLWAAQVEIAMAAGDVATAREASACLDSAASTYAATGLVATASQARGAVRLADGDATAALAALRAACGLWSELAAPYDVACTRLLLARAYRAVGDEDASALELDAAEETFTRLGAVLDAERVPQQRALVALPDGLRAARLRCSRWSLRAGATARSPPHWSSARRPSPATCPTSTRSWGCRPERPQQRTRSSTV